MQVPFFLPEELDFCRSLRSPEEVFALLQRRPLGDMVAYFEAGAQDHTWTKLVGLPLLERIFSFLSEKFLSRQLSDDLAVRAAKAIQENFFLFEGQVQEDIAFKIETEEKLTGNSLLFGTFCPFFRELILRHAAAGSGKNIPLQGISTKMFHYIKEFFYTGKIELLWREESKEILEVITIASRLHIDQMAVFASEVFKRYINRDNVVHYFMLGRERKMAALSEECCRLMGHFSLGFEVNPNDYGDLEVNLEYFTEEGNVILNKLAPLVITLSCKKQSAEDPRSVQLIGRMSKLNRLDFSETAGISPALVDSLPNVRELSLSDCDWLDDDCVIIIFSKVNRVTTLSLRGDANLSFRSWGALSSLSQLTDLDLSLANQIIDEDLDLIAASSRALTTLRLMGCRQIGDHGIQALSRQCTDLVEVDMNGLSNLTEQGIIDFAQHAERLRHWDLRNVAGLTPKALQQIAFVNSSIQEILVDEGAFSSDFLEELRKQHPSFKVETNKN